MNIPDKILDQAYAVYEEWGPKRQIDRAERLKENFRSLTDADIAAVHEIMKEISATVWEIAKMGGEAKIPKDKVTALLQGKYPFLKNEGLKRAISLINYYAWHEGYDK